MINSNGRGDAALAVPTALINEFADRYFPVAPDPRNVDPETARAHAKQMSGIYVSSRRAQSTFLSRSRFLSQVKVTSDASGQLIVPGLVDVGGEPMRWREVTPYVWQQVDGPERLAARLEGMTSRCSASTVRRPSWCSSRFPGGVPLPCSARSSASR